SLIDSDLILVVIDASDFDENEISKLFENFEEELKKFRIIGILNKIDLLEKENVLLLLERLSKLYDFNELIPLSAKTGFNIDELLNTIKKFLPENEFYYDSEAVSSSPEKFFVSEIIRKNILLLYREEIPYSVFVEIEEFREAEK